MTSHVWSILWPKGKLHTDKLSFTLPLPVWRLCLNLDHNCCLNIQYTCIYCPMIICIHASWCDDNDDNLFLIHCTKMYWLSYFTNIFKLKLLFRKRCFNSFLFQLLEFHYAFKFHVQCSFFGTLFLEFLKIKSGNGGSQWIAIGG